MRAVRLSLRLPFLESWSPAHVTYMCSSTLGNAVQSDRHPLLPPALVYFTLSIAAQHLNKYRMTADRVPLITQPH